jgi:NhaP-type Na+/H+ or K+/H+ antiporter
MSEASLLLLVCGIALFSLFSGAFSRSNITPPIAFMGLGVLLGPIGMGWVDMGVENEVIHLIAEVTLILVLFTDAVRINLKSLWADHDIPIRLLLVGMPLTIVVGALLAQWLLPELLLMEAIVLAIILAPTDAALGQAVVSSEKVPVRIRQTLNVESGLNDGVVLPVLLFAISFAAGSQGGENDTNWLSFVLLQVSLGPMSGILVGWLGARAINNAIQKKYLTPDFSHIYLLTLAFIAYLGADLIGGNGFIAAFTAGVATGNTLKQANEEIYGFAESEGQLLNLVIFFLFGVALLPQVGWHIDSSIIVYALLSLTLIRMLPVFISLLGKQLRWETTVFLGWFGPRGLASILFVLLVLDEASLVHESLVFDTAIVTVALSILLHGLSAIPGVNMYVSALKVYHLRGEDLSSEHQEVSEMPLRLSPTLDDSTSNQSTKGTS